MSIKKEYKSRITNFYYKRKITYRRDSKKKEYFSLGEHTH